MPSRLVVWLTLALSMVLGLVLQPWVSKKFNRPTSGRK